MDFNEAFTKLLGHEGAYSNHPRDPGGETMWGITAAVARAHGYKGQMRALPQAVAQAIYRKDYWDAVQADKLPAAVRYPLFDAAVNSGVKQATKWLQAALGVSQDGVLGPKTLAAAQVADGAALASAMLGARLQFMTGLSTWPTFGKGWARRIAALLAEVAA